MKQKSSVSEFFAHYFRTKAVERQNMAFSKFWNKFIIEMFVVFRSIL